MYILLILIRSIFILLLDYLFRNQIKIDIIDALNHLIEETSKSCSYSPRSSKLPIVSLEKYFDEYIINKCIFYTYR